MSESRKRNRSPISENTILRSLVQSDTEVDDDDFLSEISDSDSEVVDDTDADPDFEYSSDDESVGDELGLSLDVATPGNPRPSCSHTVDTVIESVVRPTNTTNTSFQNRPNTSNSNDVNVCNWKVVDENNDCEYPHNFSYLEDPGPKHCPPHDAHPISYFNLFFTVGFLTNIVQMTNKYARDYVNNRNQNATPTSKIWEWKNVTVEEMRAFIATILNMGLVNKNTISSYWSTESNISTPWFSQMFSRGRFNSLLQFFHVVDNTRLEKPGHPDYDPTAKFAPVTEHANRVFRTHYTPHRELSIDESLVGTKSHTQLIQYLPNKHHHRWGIKLWMLCDSVTKYCLAFYVYKGSKNATREQGLAFNVVKTLMEMGQYLGKGYHLFVDNFFSSIPLAKFLYDNSTFITGTIRRNRKGLPPVLKNKFAVGGKVYLRDENMLLLGYREKKSQKNPVLLLSTKETATSVETRKRKNRPSENSQKIKPKVINTYNMYMGGIDSCDQMLYCYLDERRTVKYWKKVVFNTFARMILNCYLLYKENSSGKLMTRLQFTSAIIKELAHEWMLHKNTLNRDNMAGGDNPQSPNFGLESLPGRQLKNCSVCSLLSTSTGGTRKRSRSVCIKCKKGVHPTCFGRHRCP